MKGKMKRVRTASDFVYQKELGTIKYKFSTEEEILIQQLGLDRFLTVVTWGVNSPEVMAQVVEELTVATFETQLNGKQVNIFQKDWKIQMQSMFYLTLHQRDIDATNATHKMSIQQLFPSLKDAKKRPENLRISECKLSEWRKPLRLLNSLLLLRTEASTVPFKFVQKLIDVWNGEKMDWREELYDNIRVELLTLHQALFKVETMITKTMVGPHVVILLAVQGHMTVEQEEKAGIWDPFRVFEKKEHPQQKRAKQGVLENKGTKDKEKSQKGAINGIDLVVEFKKHEESNSKGQDIPATSGVTERTTGKELPSLLPSVAVCTIIPHEGAQEKLVTPFSRHTQTTEVRTRDTQKANNATLEFEQQIKGGQVTGRELSQHSTMKRFTQQLYGVAKGYENFVNQIINSGSVELVDELEKKMREHEEANQKENCGSITKGKLEGEKQEPLYHQVAQLEKQLQDIKKKHTKLQEEFNQVQAEAAPEKLHKSLQEQTRLIEENVKFKNLNLEQQKERESLQKEVTDLKDTSKTNAILHKQQMEGLKRLNLELREKEKLQQGQLETFQIKVLELEDLRDLKQKHIKLQEELTRAHKEAAAEKDRFAALQDQSKSEDEILKLRATCSELQKEVLNLQGVERNTATVHKQQVVEMQRINLEAQKELAKHKEATIEQIGNLQGEVKQLEERIKTYQRKDEGYVEALIRSAAYETWVEEDKPARESIQKFQNRVAEITQETIQALHIEIERLIQSKEELQDHLEKMTLANQDFTPEFRKRIEPVLKSQHNLPPPISIPQYYSASRNLILMKEGLPLFKPGDRLSKEDFIKYWKKARPEGRDTLTFMWMMGELKLPTGVLELAAVQPGFYISRYCARAITRITEHHQAFYTIPKIDERNAVPIQYTATDTEKIQTMVQQNEDDFKTAVEGFAQEDLSVFTEATKCHQWLKKYHSSSFSSKFCEIDLHQYINNVLQGFEEAKKKRKFESYTSEVLLTVPALNPRHWRMTKRS